jgi:mono/diheme cytochrome c family protein
MGKAMPTGVPNCTVCHGPRQAVAQEAIPENIWNEKLAPLWEMMAAQDQAPSKIAYCAKCKEYGILGGWQSF